MSPPSPNREEAGLTVSGKAFSNKTPALQLAVGSAKELPRSSPWQHLPCMVEANRSGAAKEPGLRQALQDVAAHGVLAAGRKSQVPSLNSFHLSLGTRFLDVGPEPCSCWDSLLPYSHLIFIPIFSCPAPL